MFNIELLKSNYLTITGSSVIKMIQNNYMPTLDLIVRESIQNSLDAALENKNTVKVDFKYDEFYVDSLADQFEHIGERIKQKFKNNEKSNYICISDKNTIGLVGNLDGKFEHGAKNQNLGKLVFHIMKAQDKEGAGGSWGIGKTVYYRIGIGLVIYYSRVKLANNQYQQRLIAVLVEDELSSKGLLSDDKFNNGVAFFGEKMEDSIQAITDDNYITKFLKIFNINPYIEDETGTQIIIPFLNSNDILSSTKNEVLEEQWWLKSVTNYLEVSILRWYFPRMAEKYNYGPRLEASINGKNVETTVETILFDKYMSLYNLINEEEIPEGIYKERITRNKNVENELIGTFIYTKLNDFDLGNYANQTINYLQFDYIMNGEKTPPIVAFTRRPGMIVNYEVYSNQLMNIELNEKIIGIFVLNSNNNITSPIKINLDEYIRKSEKADHTSWEDTILSSKSNKLLIVGQIKKNIVSSLDKSFGIAKKSNGEITINNHLANKFGQLLLPEEGFGQLGGGKKTPVDTDGRGATSKKKNSVVLSNVKYKENEIVISYSIVLKKLIKGLEFLNKIQTISKSFDADEWEKQGLSYPCNINKILLMKDNEIGKSVIVFENEKEKTFEGYKVDLIKTSNGKTHGVKLNRYLDNASNTFTLKIFISTTDPQVRTIFEIKMLED